MPAGTSVLSVCGWLVSPSLMPSVHLCRSLCRIPLLLRQRTLPTVHIITGWACSSVDRSFSPPHSRMSMGVQTLPWSLCSQFFWIPIQPCICWIREQFYFCGFEELPSIFHSSYATSHSHQHCTRVPTSPQPSQRLFSVFLITAATLMGVRQQLSAVYFFDIL